MSSDVGCQSTACAKLETSGCIIHGASAGFDSLTSRSLSLRPSRLCRGFPSRSILDFARDDRTAPPSHFEALAQVKLATDGIVDEEIFGAFALNASIVN